MARRPLTIVDTAHNWASIQALLRTLQCDNGQTLDATFAGLEGSNFNVSIDQRVFVYKWIHIDRLPLGTVALPTRAVTRRLRSIPFALGPNALSVSARECRLGPVTLAPRLAGLGPAALDDLARRLEALPALVRLEQSPWDPDAWFARGSSRARWR